MESIVEIRNSDKYYIKSFTNDLYLSYGDDKYEC